MALIQSVVLSITSPNLVNCVPYSSRECKSSSGIKNATSKGIGSVGRNSLQQCVGSSSQQFSQWKPVVRRKEGSRLRICARAGKVDGDGRSRRTESKAASLRRILAEPGVHLGPACFDGLSARLVEQAGFSYAFMSGFAVAAARLGAPDMGLLSYAEVLDQGRLITDAVSIPVIGDGDNGYGSVLNVKRTVRGFIQAGFAGILIEDQESPKSCGHFGGKKVVSREEALKRIKAAVDARDESSSDIVIIARSDARQAESLEEALWRVEQFAALGADVVFLDALASVGEMVSFCKVAPGTPKMANMLEGGGRTPILSPKELEDMGFKLVAYPLSLMGVAMQAMQDALKGLKTGQIPQQDKLPSFEEMKWTLGIEDYFREERRYEESLPQQPPAEAPAENVAAKETEVVNPSESPVIVRGARAEFRGAGSEALQSISSRVLRVKVTGRDGIVKLDVEIPAGFLEPLASGIPVFAGVNVRQLLEESLATLSGGTGGGKILVDFSSRNGDRVQIILVQPFVS